MRIQAVTPQKATQVFAMVSDEDGMGKTSIVANLAFALTKLQKTVLVMDTGFGLGNLKILRSSTPQYREVEIVFQKWHRAAQQLLGVVGHRDLLSGGISRQIQVRQALRPQKTVVGIYPNVQTSRAFLNEPWRFVHCHNHLAERSEAILLAAAVSLKDKPWAQQ
jgi:hypothetical protein